MSYSTGTEQCANSHRRDAFNFYERSILTEFHERCEKVANIFQNRKNELPMRSYAPAGTWCTINGNSMESLATVANCFEFDDRGAGFGNDCSFLSFADAFAVEAEEEAQIAARLRAHVCELMANYDYERKVWPAFEEIMDFAAAKDYSERLVNAYAVHATEVRSNHARNTRSATGAAAVASFRKTLSARINELRNNNALLDETEWLFPASILQRRIMVLQAVRQRSAKELEELDVDIRKHNVVVPPPSYAGDTRFLQVNYYPSDSHLLPRVRQKAPLPVGFVSNSDDIDCEPIHYVRVHAKGANDIEGSIEIECNANAQRPPFVMDIGVWESGTATSATELILQLQTKYLVCFYKATHSSVTSKIEYRCQHENAYLLKARKSRARSAAKRNGDTISDEHAEIEDECAGKIVFLQGLNGNFIVHTASTVLEHTCPAVKPFKNISLDIILERLCAPGASVPETNGGLKRKLNDLSISDSMASKARREAIKRLYGTNEVNFKTLPALFQKIKSADENFVFAIERDENNVFMRCFVCFSYARTLWLHSLRVMMIDACHSKYELGGIYLVATTQLSSGAILMLAAGFSASNEDGDSWKYFLQNLKNSCVADEASIVILSDRDKGIASSLNAVYPLADKVACSRHIGNNAKHHAKLLKARADAYINQLAKAYTASDYAKIEERMRNDRLLERSKVDELLRYLRAEAQWNEDWCLHASVNPSRRYGIVTSNAVEVMNSVLRPARLRPIAAAFWEIIKYAHERYGRVANDIINSIRCRYSSNNASGTDVEFDDDVAPGKFAELIDQHSLANQKYRLVVSELDFIANNVHVWRVQRADRGGRNSHAELQRIVKHFNESRKFECSCKLPFYVGIPCRHILAVISNVSDVDGSRRPRWRYTDALDPRLTVKALKQSVSYDILNSICIDNHDVNASQSAFVLHAHAPVMNENLRQFNRQSKQARIASRGETRKRGTYKCSWCKRAGHNRSNCPNQDSPQVNDEDGAE